MDGVQEHFHPTANPSGSGGWNTSKNSANVGQPGALGFNQFTASFADVLTAIPDATITTFSGLGIGQGSGNAGLESHVDNFQVNGNNWDFEVQAPAARTVTVNAPAQLTTGNQPVAFTGTATNNPGAAIPNARYDITFTGDPGLTADQLVLEYQLPGSTSFAPVPLTGTTTAGGGSITGSFGPPTGFTFPADTSITTNFRISVKSGAPSGTLTSVVKLDTVDGNGVITGTVATSAPATTQISTPTVSINAPAQLTVGGAPVAFTGTANNPGAAINNARYDIAFTGGAGLTADQITLKYQLPDSTFGTVPLTGSTANGGTITGYFGPQNGFTFPAGATPTTNFTIAIAAGAPVGALTSVVTLDTVKPATGAVTGTVATSAPKVSQIVAAPPGGAYHALTPQRITDTRTGSTQPNAGNTLPAGGTVTVQMPAGTVPVGATSVALSVTRSTRRAPGS